MIILWNNRFVRENEATIPLLSEAVLFGLGAFETLRAHSDGYIIELDAHIKPLHESLDSINLPLSTSEEDLKNQVISVVKKGKPGLQRLRILVVPEGVAVTSIPLEVPDSAYHGVSLKSVVQNRAIPKIKSLSYLECLLSYREAEKSGFFEALLVNSDGQVFEGSRSNIFWVIDGQTYTRESDVLAGITRKLVLDNIHPDAKFSNINIDKLKTADEVFMSSSTLGVVPVVQIDKDKIGNGNPGKVTRNIWDSLKRYYY